MIIKKETTKQNEKQAEVSKFKNWKEKDLFEALTNVEQISYI